MPDIVWAEDSEDDRFLIRSVLEAGVSVEFAEDGVAALDLARRHRPRLVVLDVKMPRVGGLDALRVLRGDPELAATRAVMFSSSGQPGEIEEARRLGASGYVQKPIDFGAFRAAVRAIAAQAKPPPGAPAPSHHVLFWETEGALLETVATFLRAGRRAGDGLVVLATAPRLQDLRQALGEADGDQWLDAGQVLDAITVGGRADPRLFADAFRAAHAQASQGGRSVTMFGELVTLLQQRGESDAAVAIEGIGQAVARQHAGRLSILCAYPLADVAAGGELFDRICAEHTGQTVQAHAVGMG